MEKKKTLASVIGNNWMVSPEFIGDYLPILSGFLQNKDLKKYFDSDTPVFNIQSFEIENSINKSETKVGLINLSGIVFKNDQLCGPIGTSSMISKMKDWEANGLVDSVLFYTSSPGGEASGTRRFAKFIENYSLPTAAFIEGIAGSAAYYIIAATDKVFMEPDADLVGSIGAMTSYKNIDKYLEKQGIELVDVYADSSYDKNLVSRQLKEGDTTLLKEALNPLATKFENDVKSFRPDLKDEACHGKVYAPDAALKVGLIDALGSFEDVVSYLQQNSKSKNNNKNNYQMNKSFPKIENLLDIKEGFQSNESGTYLNENQFDVVENKLSALETEKTNLTDAKKLVDDKVTAMQTTIDDTLTADAAIVAAANTSLELEGDAKVTDVAGAIAALNSKITLLGAGPGAQHTNLGADGKPKVANAQMDFNTDFYKKTQELFN